MQHKDSKNGKLRFEAKEHADKCVAAAHAETGERSFEFDGGKGVLKLKLFALSADAEKEAWQTYRERAVAKENASKRRRSGAGGRTAKRRC
jgi:hypothetical protein